MEDPRAIYVCIVGHLPFARFAIVGRIFGSVSFGWLLVRNVDPGLETNVSVWRYNDCVPPVANDPAECTVLIWKILWKPLHLFLVRIPKDFAHAPLRIAVVQLPDFFDEERADMDMERMENIGIIDQ